MDETDVIRSKSLFRLSNSNNNNSQMSSEPRKRAKRWSREEIQALIMGIARHKKHILGTLSGDVTMRTKKAAWLDITNLVNSVNTSGHKRRIPQVEHKWYDIKCLAKVRIREYEKSDSNKSTKPVQPPTDIDWKVYRIMAGLKQNLTDDSFKTANVEEWLSQTSITTIDLENKDNIDEMLTSEMNELSNTTVDHPLFYHPSPASQSMSSMQSSSPGSSSRTKEQKLQSEIRNHREKVAENHVYHHSKVKAEVIQDPDIIPQVREVYTKKATKNNKNNLSEESDSINKPARLITNGCRYSESETSDDSKETLTPPRKIRRKMMKPQSKNNTDNKIGEILDLLKERPKVTEMNEDDMFMTSMASALKRIEPTRRFKVKMGIMKLIHDAVTEC